MNAALPKAAAAMFGVLSVSTGCSSTVNETRPAAGGAGVVPDAAGNSPAGTGGADAGASKPCERASDCPPGPEWTCSFAIGIGRTCECASSGPEACDGRDNDCNGVVDDAACAGAFVCQNHACVCPTERQCGPDCVDTSTDVAHCGGCDTVCPLGATCRAGACVCPAANALCSGTCADLTSDALNCGSCAHACGQLEACVLGECTCAHTLCNGACASLDDDPKNCGACAHDCAGGACIDAVCKSTVLVEEQGASSMLLYQNQLYWFAGLEIRRANVDGTNVTTLATGVSTGALFSPPIAAGASGFYWSDSAEIFRIPLDGSASPVVVVPNNFSGYALNSITVDSSHLYWSMQDGFVNRANHDGTNVTVLASNQNDPTSILVNATNAYWANSAYAFGGASSVAKVDLDGSNLTTLWFGQSNSIALSATNLCWSDSAYIWRGDLDGRNPRRLARGSGYRLLVDDPNVYWLGTTDQRMGLWRTTLASGATLLLVAEYASALATDTAFLYYTVDSNGSAPVKGIMRLAK